MASTRCAPGGRRAPCRADGSRGGWLSRRGLGIGGRQDRCEKRVPLRCGGDRSGCATGRRDGAIAPPPGALGSDSWLGTALDTASHRMRGAVGGTGLELLRSQVAPSPYPLPRCGCVGARASRSRWRRRSVAPSCLARGGARGRTPPTLQRGGGYRPDATWERRSGRPVPPAAPRGARHARCAAIDVRHCPDAGPYAPQ